MNSYTVTLHIELVIQAESAEDATVKAAEHFQAANSVDFNDFTAVECAECAPELPTDGETR